MFHRITWYDSNDTRLCCGWFLFVPGWRPGLFWEGPGQTADTRTSKDADFGSSAVQYDIIVLSVVMYRMNQLTARLVRLLRTRYLDGQILLFYVGKQLFRGQIFFFVQSSRYMSIKNERIAKNKTNIEKRHAHARKTKQKNDSEVNI